MSEIKQYFPNTYALVMCGGQSNRMGSDKSLLQYYDKPQRYYVYEMLMPFCEKIYIACSAEQVNSIKAGYNFIPDDETFSDIGPMGALLTAFTKYPDRHILLIGCDYPFLKAAELQTFSKLCIDIPVSFYNKEAVIYESMLAWYPCTCFVELKQMFDAEQFSLQQLLRKRNAVKYTPTDIDSIRSIDTNEAFALAVKEINTG
jgi:molybdopterin-guanine dinucleotide biosynthesis protein A